MKSYILPHNIRVSYIVNYGEYISNSVKLIIAGFTDAGKFIE